MHRDALEQALEQIIARHGSLRTTFTTVNGEPRQRVVERLSGYLRHEDLGNLPDSEKESSLERLVREEMLSPFDLEAGPLLRIVLFRLTDNEQVLLINMHHIVSDGWSMAGGELKTSTPVPRGETSPCGPTR